MFFRLKPTIYAAFCDSGIVILDLQHDKYFSLTDEAAHYFTEALNKEFAHNRENYIPMDQSSGEENDHDGWIHHFLEQGFIESSEQKESSKTLKTALKPGGLADYQWDTKDKLASFSQSPKLLVLQLFFLIMRVDFMLRRKGIKGVYDKIEKYKRLHKTFKEPSQKEIEMLSAALDVASSLYPKKIFCLAWASTFVLMALKKGWKCNLVIGVQSPPFYAHAWAQIGDAVINDAPVIKERLSIIFQEPFNQG